MAKCAELGVDPEKLAQDADTVNKRQIEDPAYHAELLRKQTQHLKPKAKPAPKPAPKPVVKPVK